MLSPYDRTALFDALRPPPGYTLDQAVGTSFTLDLEALLTAPIAFALFDAGEEDRVGNDGDGGLEPVGLLEAIRRHATRITMFCQAGQIAVPTRHRTVFAWLEGAVHEVPPPRPGHLFHPKVWVVRYRSTAGHLHVLRLLCGTRNLTFDTSWDTLLCLESDPYGARPEDTQTRQEAVARFVRSLPGMPVHRVDDDRLVAIADLADDLAAVPLAVPEPFEQMHLHVLGTGDDPPAAPPPGAREAAVVSPFLSDPWLRRFQAACPGGTLIAREESLDRTDPAVLRGFDRLAVLNPTVDMGTGEETAESPDAGADPGRLFAGLHAKLFVFDTDEGAVVYSGSANATDAAFGGNVEVVAELRGPADAGVKGLLGDTPGERTFGDLVIDYVPLPEAVAETDADRLELALDDLRRRFASLVFEATVMPDGDDFQLALTSDQPLPLPQGRFAGAEVTATIRPATLAEGQSASALELGEPADARFGVTLEGVSAFFVVTLTARMPHASGATRFVLTTDLVGAPADRHSRLLAAMLRDPDRLLRYLVMLLADEQSMLDGAVGDAGQRWLSRWAGAGWDEMPLLELLVRAADRYPDRLDHIERLMQDLGEQGNTVLPPGFEAVWEPVLAYRRAEERTR